ncbi:MAG: hypothetical protein IPO63_13140 [Bacteroidetes bacterium]|nr:hypothetical protein [Bacteroidota bacterium]
MNLIHDDVATPFPRHCFIPTISSLALNISGNDQLAYPVKSNVLFNRDRRFVQSDPISPFDALYAPDGNQGHMQITYQNICWTMAEVSPPICTYKNKNLNKSALFEARDYIVSGKNVDPLKVPFSLLLDH